MAQKETVTRLWSINHNCGSQKRDSSRRWSTLIVLMTHAIIAVYVRNERQIV